MSRYDPMNESIKLEKKRVLLYNEHVETIHSPSDSVPGYHHDNKMITEGCTGRRIGVPQRIRVTTWNQTHINYTKCVKSERVGIMII